MKRLLSALATVGLCSALSAQPAVAINEFVASNDASAADEAGEFDDWIELYNNTSAAIDLTGYTLSDNPENIAKWQFPDGTTIEANGYLIVWADEDGDEDQGPLHASFKLSAGGETLALGDPNGNVVDNVEFGQQETDVAFARVPNGTGEFRMQAPTFNADNSSTSVTTLEELGLRAYPNPATETLFLQAERQLDLPVKLYDMTGHILFEGELRRDLRIDVSGFPAGNYVLRVGRTAKLIQVR
ncbi:lamin tail domain-containing protein [Lewinella sp. 4G2]|uniref:lamin tail domain-containing protein n=1 Tax=Lewinella sp. 4G2 TaxID=1803372 RepID=UPI0007B4D288|nr:lamin tail domain-containing protein [Lewinella sp. 4G2]OAV45626.1 hypothetical protein A3850_014490 [Lewinella sp. 4G2]